MRGFYGWRLGSTLSGGWKTKREPTVAPALGCGLSLTEILVLAVGERQAGQNLGPFFLDRLQGAGIESESL
jgi:hypothetical protein